MEGMEQTIGNILSDPNAMSQIISLAQSLGLGAPKPDAHKPPESPNPPLQSQPSMPNADLDGFMNMLRTLTASGAMHHKHAALFQALRPYLSQHRQQKLDQAMQIARLSQLAGLALRQSGQGHQEGR